MKLSLICGLVTAILALSIPESVFAAEIRSGDSITIGPNETVADDMYAFGNTVLVQGTVRGDLVAAGSSVTIAGHVTGSVLAAGNAVVVNGPVDGSVRIAGNVLTVSAPVGSDVLMAGSTVTVNAPARVSRDALVAGGSMSVLAPVGRNVSAAGNVLTIGSTVGGGVDASVTELVLGSGAAVQGPISYISNRDATVERGAMVPGLLERTPRVARTANPWEVVGVDTLTLIRGFIGLAALGIILALAFPRSLTEATSTLSSRWAASLGLGFASLLVVPAFSLLVLVLGAVIGGWWIGLMLLAIYAILLVLAYLVFAEWVGSAALHLSKFNPHTIGALLLGLAILAVVTVIPVIGALVAITGTIFGMGAIGLTGWRGYRRTPTSETVPETAPAPAPVPAAA